MALVCVTSAEMAALAELHPDCTLLYLVLRFAMDAVTGIAGLKTSITYAALATDLARRPNRIDYTQRRVTESFLRARLLALQRARLIEKMPAKSAGSHLVFYLPQAYRGRSVQKTNDTPNVPPNDTLKLLQNNDLAYTNDTPNVPPNDTISRDQVLSCVSKKQRHKRQAQKAPLGADSPQAARLSCPHKKIIQLYRDVLPELPDIADWTPSRRARLRASWAEHPSMTWWAGYFEAVRNVPYLMGRVNGFRASLPWLVDREHIAEVVERKYERRV